MLWTTLVKIRHDQNVRNIFSSLLLEKKKIRLSNQFYNIQILLLSACKKWLATLFLVFLFFPYPMVLMKFKALKNGFKGSDTLKLPAEQFNLNLYFVQIKARRCSTVLSLAAPWGPMCKVKQRGADGWNKSTNLMLPSHSTNTEELPTFFCWKWHRKS